MFSLLPKGSDFFLSWSAGGEKIISSTIELLPGGRWILGNAHIGTYRALACWDLKGLIGTQEQVLEPVAKMRSRRDHFPDGGQPIPMQLDMQYDATDNAVNILFYCYPNTFK